VILRLKVALAIGAMSVLAHAHAASVTVTDDTGAHVALATPVHRIVSLAPNATEMLFAAGAGGAVVGVVASSDWPPAARTLPRVGDANALDLERILALRPELVVTWPYTMPAQVTFLRDRGIAVFVIDPRTVEGIASALERIGRLAGDERLAREEAARLRQREQALRERFAHAKVLRVFYEVWPAPLQTLGGDHIVSRAIETCGARNVFATSLSPAPNVTVEAVLATRPEVIVAGADDGRRPEWLDAWRRWRELPAVAERNLYAVDADLLHRAGPRFIDGVAQLCEVLDEARRKHGASGAVPGR